MAPLQKRALYGLAFGVVWAVAMIVVFIAKGGVGTFSEDQGFRLIVVIWTIVLTETYWDQGIPPIFMYIVFIATLVVSAVAQSIGILIGYWRGVSHG